MNRLAAASPSSTRVIAIDPSLARDRYAILEKAGGKLRAVEYGVIKNGTNCCLRRASWRSMTGWRNWS